tara:strand:- start:11 stop:214 length:204 start_codon:yes stop_codon:yes gene_type:complete
VAAPTLIAQKDAVAEEIRASMGFLAPSYANDDSSDCSSCSSSYDSDSDCSSEEDFVGQYVAARPAPP